MEESCKLRKGWIGNILLYEWAGALLSLRQRAFYRVMMLNWGILPGWKLLLGRCLLRKRKECGEAVRTGVQLLCTKFPDMSELFPLGKGARMKDLAMWLQPWLSNESSEEWGLASSAWCSWKMAARRETKPCWLGLSERSEVAVSSRKCCFESVGSWLAHLLLPVYKWLPDEIHFSSWKWYSINR